jgi:uncharacterized protein YebE (UPF0316 family)
MVVFLQSALLLFSLRLVDISLYTVRIMMVVRGRKRLAWLFGFCQAIIYVTALRAVLSDVGNWGKIIGYAAGFATGIILGMWIEERLAIGYTHLRIITPWHGVELAERLRKEGYAVTEVPAYGKEGMVTLLNCSVRRKHAHAVEKVVSAVDPQAFITAEAVRAVRKGFWG